MLLSSPLLSTDYFNSLFGALVGVEFRDPTKETSISKAVEFLYLFASYQKLTVPHQRVKQADTLLVDTLAA